MPLQLLDDRLKDDENLSVWLVIRDHAQFESVATAFLELLMRARRDSVVLKIERTNFSTIDRFIDRFDQPSNEDWAKWQLYRLAEIGLEIMCYGLARAIIPAQTPEKLFRKGWAPGFREFRNHGLIFATGLPTNTNAWGAKFFSGVLKNDAAAKAIEAVIEQRNNFARGRASLPLAEVKKLVVESLQLDAWSRISETDGKLQLADWKPWVVTSSTVTDRVGLFERWQESGIHYLVPDTGEVFEIACAESNL